MERNGKKDIDVECYEELGIRGKKRKEISRFFALDTFPQRGLVHLEKRHVSRVRTSSLWGHRYDDVDPFFSFSCLRLSRFISWVLPYYSYHSQPMVIDDRRQLSNYRHLRLGASEEPAWSPRLLAHGLEYQWYDRYTAIGSRCLLCFVFTKFSYDTSCVYFWIGYS